MIKGAFNLKQIKTATSQRAAQFRLEDDIVFSASGKQTDPYRVVITAKRVRDRFMVALMMNHEPTQSIVYSDSWTFNRMETCWEKYHNIRDIVTDVRNFVEVEGVKTVVAQYMVRHNLANISSEVEDANETAIPYIRPTIDTSSRGNLLKNFPTIPFHISTGPDRLDEVYKSTGTAPNPVPEDGISGPHIYKHDRNKMGLKDVIPSPLSGFQAAAMNAGLPLARASRTDKQMHTANLKKQAKSNPVVDTAIRKFLKKIKDNSPQSVRQGREEAIEYYTKNTGALEDEARTFYESVKTLCSNGKIVLDMQPEEMIRFFADGIYVPGDLDGRTYNSSSMVKNREISRALDIDMMPIRANLRIKPSGASGTFGLVLTPPKDTAYFNGSLDRLRNPSRLDYLENPVNCLYGPDSAVDCKASSIIRSIPMGNLAGGPFRLTHDLATGDKEYGNSEALIFGRVVPDMVEEIIVDNDEAVAQVRRILDKLGKIIPVNNKTQIEVVDPSKIDEIQLVSKPSVESIHFQPSDRVVMKPRLNNPSLKGSIADTSHSATTIQWDNGERHIYDTAEALMRILPQPGEAQPVEGMVIYNLPGMDNETVRVLNSFGVDPVTVHSLVSHAMPVSKSAKGWEDVLTRSFEDLGLFLRKIAGYAYSNEDKPFVRKNWFEAKLPEGGRLVIELAPSKILIRAGDADDYIIPTKPLIFE